MRERLKAVAVAAASFVVVTGSIVSVGLANAEPASAQIMGQEAGQKLAMAWTNDAASDPFVYARTVEVASLR